MQRRRQRLAWPPDPSASWQRAVRTGGDSPGNALFVFRLLLGRPGAQLQAGDECNKGGLWRQDQRSSGGLLRDGRARARARWLQARSAGSAGGTCTHTARPPHLSRGQRPLQEQQSYAGLQAAQHTRGVWHRVDTRLWAPFVGGRHFALCPPFALTAFPGRISGCAAIATWGRRPALETGTPLVVNWPPGRLWSHRWETGVSGGLFEKGKSTAHALRALALGALG